MLRVATALAILATIGSDAFAFELGDTVIAIREAELKVGNRVVDKVFPGTDLTIGDINGNFLWVSRGHPGWVESRHVVALNQAIPVLTEMIRKNPRDARLYNGRASV